MILARFLLGLGILAVLIVGYVCFEWMIGEVRRIGGSLAELIIGWALLIGIAYAIGALIFKIAGI